MAMNNSLAEVHPELVSEWSEKNLPLTPDDITFGSNKKVWRKGACGHEWQTSVKARSNGENCPICSGARIYADILQSDDIIKKIKCNVLIDGLAEDEKRLHFNLYTDVSRLITGFFESLIGDYFIFRFLFRLFA